MDTLSFLMQILWAVVECAKVVIATVAFVLFSILCKYLPFKLKWIIPRLTATAFVLTVVGANFEQYFNFVSLSLSRVGSIILALSGSVTFLVILFTVILVTAMIGRKDISYRTDFYFDGLDKEVGTSRVGALCLTNSFLATTPVLLS